MTPRMEAIWRSGNYTGSDRRPVARVTVQKPRMSLRYFSQVNTRVFFETDSANKYATGIEAIRNAGGTLPGARDFTLDEATNVYADYLFSAEDKPVEIESVMSVRWERTTDIDAATATITIANVVEHTSGNAVGINPIPATIDLGGGYTFDHGVGAFAAGWGQIPTKYRGLLMPDNLIRTYEGYGHDLAVGPEDDPSLVLSGVWIIDSVEMANSPEGPVMTVTCRDTMRLLTDHFAFPPVVPRNFYPLHFAKAPAPVETVHDVLGDPYTASRDSSVTEVRRVDGRLERTSNAFHHPDNNAGSSSNDAAVMGHRPADALDERSDTYWLSTGNDHPSARYAYEWFELRLERADVSFVQIEVPVGGFTAYVSVITDGTWLGQGRIDYHRDGIGRNGADIAYLASAQLSAGMNYIGLEQYNLTGVQSLRITFGNLQNLGGTFPYRAAMSQIAVRATSEKKVTTTYTRQDVVSRYSTFSKPKPAGSNPGWANDFTDIIKLLCAWAGLHWPTDAYLRHTSGSDPDVAFSSSDEDVLGEGMTGRVWGDFMQTGTMAISELTSAVFDQKPLMDGLREVKDITGFVLFADESGAVQWRLPNIYEIGNWITGLSKNPGRTTRVLVLDEAQLLTGIRAVLSSANLRESIYVASPGMDAVSVVAGYVPNNTGLRRIGGWSDSNFKSKAETQMMADMIAVRQLFTYRTNTVTIPGYPGIQIDDQVQIVERTTSEGHVHYVKGISSTLDNRTGEWTYQLQTHWLGDRVARNWIIEQESLSPPHQVFNANAAAHGADTFVTRVV